MKHALKKLKTQKMYYKLDHFFTVNTKILCTQSLLKLKAGPAHLLKLPSGHVCSLKGSKQEMDNDLQALNV